MSGQKRATGNLLENRLESIKKNEDPLERDDLIQDYIPFIIKTIASQLNRYIETENSDEFSIGLIAFNEAIDKYDAAKGNFLSFAELVIRNRVKDLYRKKQKEQREISLEGFLENSPENSPEICNEIDDDSIALREEIKKYEAELRTFGISFEDLAAETPKHADTRLNAVKLSERISEDKIIVKEIYAKKKLPVSKIVFKFQTTIKIVKRSKRFILSMVIIFAGGFNQLRIWVKNSMQGE